VQWHGRTSVRARLLHQLLPHWWQRRCCDIIHPAARRSSRWRLLPAGVAILRPAPEWATCRSSARVGLAGWEHAVPARLLTFDVPPGSTSGRVRWWRGHAVVRSRLPASRHLILPAILRCRHWVGLCRQRHGRPRCWHWLTIPLHDLCLLGAGTCEQPRADMGGAQRLLQRCSLPRRHGQHCRWCGLAERQVCSRLPQAVLTLRLARCLLGRNLRSQLLGIVRLGVL